jgi:KaiC/GvpD/RAD55 family RecA-like ATPase
MTISAETTGRTTRIKTYIEGLDEKMEGGIPVGNVVLLAGEPGTMKSTVAYHLAYENARKEGRKGLYVTMEQSRDSLIRNMESVGMRLGEAGDALSIVDIGHIRKSLTALGNKSWMEILKMYATNMKESHGYDLLVLDSLPVIETLSEFQNPRNDLFHFFEWIRGLGVTCVLITETRRDPDGFGPWGEDYLADGIVQLLMAKVNEETIQRRVRIVKMRSTNHATNLYSLIVEKGTFRTARVIST